MRLILLQAAGAVKVFSRINPGKRSLSGSYPREKCNLFRLIPKFFAASTPLGGDALELKDLSLIFDELEIIFLI